MVKMADVPFRAKEKSSVSENWERNCPKRVDARIEADTMTEKTTTARQIWKGLSR